MTTETKHVYAPSEIDEQLVESKRCKTIVDVLNGAVPPVLAVTSDFMNDAFNVAISAAVRLGEIVEQQREEIALLQNAVKLHAPGWKLKCNSKDIDPATYANLIDCDVCFNVHSKPKCEEPV